MNNGKSVESRFLLLNFDLESREGTLLGKFALYYQALLLRLPNTRCYICISYDFFLTKWHLTML